MREQVKMGVEGNLPERDDEANAWQRLDLGVKMWQAIVDFCRRRLVSWRRAAHGRGDERVMKLQAVVGIARCWKIRKPGAVKRCHQKIAGTAHTVAGEHTARAVRSVGGWRQAEDQQARARIAKPGYRAGPIGLVAVRTPLLSPDAFAVPAQTWTAIARDDGLAEATEVSRQRSTALVEQYR